MRITTAGPCTSLRIDLRDDDVLFYLHLPKTGGLSLITMLDQQYSKEEILPIHSDFVSGVFEGFPEAQLRKYRFARGHFCFGAYDDALYRHVVQNPICITLLRHPVARTVSAFRYFKRNPRIEVHAQSILIEDEGSSRPVRLDERQDRLARSVHGMSLREYVENPVRFDSVYNRQTRFLFGGTPGFPAFPGDPNAISEAAILQVAQDRLEQFAFVGLTEQFHDSCRLLAYQLGLPPFESIPHINRAPEEESIEVDEVTLESIRAVNRLDLALYETAEKLFAQRWAALADRFLP